MELTSATVFMQSSILISNAVTSQEDIRLTTLLGSSKEDPLKDSSSSSSSRNLTVKGPLILRVLLSAHFQVISLPRWAEEPQDTEVMLLYILTRLFLKAAAGQPETPLSLQEVPPRARGQRFNSLTPSLNTRGALRAERQQGYATTSAAAGRQSWGMSLGWRSPCSGLLSRQNILIQQPCVGKLNLLSPVCWQDDIGILATDWLWRKPCYADYTLWHASVYFPKGSDFGMETCLDGLPYPQAVTTSTCLVIAPSLLSRATAADDNYPYPIATRIWLI